MGDWGKRITRGKRKTEIPKKAERMSEKKKAYMIWETEHVALTFILNVKREVRKTKNQHHMRIVFARRLVTE